MKFKVGDKVRVIKSTQRHSPELIIGNTYKIKYIDEADEERPYRLDNKGNNWVCDNEIELINTKPTRQELLDMPVGTKIYTDRDISNVYIKVSESDFCNNYADYIVDININNNLSLDTCFASEDKIIKIEKPTYETVYDYSTEVQEMTLAEIEKALGHAVKIIKEDK